MWLKCEINLITQCSPFQFERLQCEGRIGRVSGKVQRQGALFRSVSLSIIIFISIFVPKTSFGCSPLGVNARYFFLIPNMKDCVKKVNCTKMQKMHYQLWLNQTKIKIICSSSKWACCADPSQWNSTSRQNPPIEQNRRNFYTNIAILMPFKI